ncbi:lipopolysaccharide cholinephosphotransferase [Pseudobutyrivibrio xylanivorans]|uniref:Lipopolysaccharide cholinephosphotransferase n=2 Tax=Pseudobutyrivibrio xylanivorans TaxID=185007 RepID=A0A1G5S636_PSEXY|nr:lipopolysaccharide cholinephosphotransferase [Pseudobutyrivibrio xylanivorans]
MQNIYDVYGIRELQGIILEIMVYIDSFCNSNQIEYCICGGTALGARRNNGFIPWDDDIDIYMTAKEYNKFKKIFLEKGDLEKYYLQEYGKTKYKNKDMITMAKIRMNNSYIDETGVDSNWNIHKGIFVDIFILHNLPEVKYKRAIQYCWSELVVLKGLQKRNYNTENFKYRVMLSIIKLFPTRWLLKHGLYNVYKYDDLETIYLQDFIGSVKYKNSVFPYNSMYPSVRGNFEKVALQMPADNDKYLEIEYGRDYLTPPPIEEIPIGKHIVNWKTNVKIDYFNNNDEVKLI